MTKDQLRELFLFTDLTDEQARLGDRRRRRRFAADTEVFGRGRAGPSASGAVVGHDPMARLIGATGWRRGARPGGVYLGAVTF